MFLNTSNCGAFISNCGVFIACEHAFLRVFLRVTMYQISNLNSWDNRAVSAYRTGNPRAVWGVVWAVTWYLLAADDIIDKLRHHDDIMHYQ